jgi:hypothetical protein
MNRPGTAIESGRNDSEREEANDPEMNIDQQPCISSEGAQDYTPWRKPFDELAALTARIRREIER